jgi:two-component system chemotaxis response regulator CheY
MSAQRRVLLVDDSAAVAHQLREIVDGSGRYTVVGHAKNGADALRLCSELTPNVVLLDLVMPIMDGLATLRILRQRHPDVAVLVVSSVGGVAEKAAEALKLGARGVISKPFEADTILRTIDSTGGGAEK